MTQKEIDHAVEAALAYANQQIEVTRSSAIKTIIKEAKRSKGWFVIPVLLMLLVVFAFPIALAGTFAHWPQLFTEVWARVVVFCVPQLVLCIVCIVALLARSRENEY